MFVDSQLCSVRHPKRFTDRLLLVQSTSCNQYSLTLSLRYYQNVRSYLGVCSWIQVLSDDCFRVRTALTRRVDKDGIVLLTGIEGVTCLTIIDFGFENMVLKIPVEPFCIWAMELRTSHPLGESRKSLCVFVAAPTATLSVWALCWVDIEHRVGFARCAEINKILNVGSNHNRKAPQINLQVCCAATTLIRKLGPDMASCPWEGLLLESIDFSAVFGVWLFTTYAVPWFGHTVDKVSSVTLYWNLLRSRIAGR